MTAAIVKTTCADRGFLFVTVDDRDVFVHQKAFGDRRGDFNRLTAGSLIFVDDLREGPKGWWAETAVLDQGRAA